MKRLPWADVILLVIISSARLISHSHLRCDWSTHLVVIVRAQWASAGIFPVLSWLAGCGCWRHGAASWSEWEAGLKRGVGPERETGEGAPRSSERHGVGPAKRILRLDRFFFLSTVSYLEVLKNNRSAWDTQSDSVVRVNLQRLCVSSKPLELSEKKKIDWELRCGWGFLWGFCTELMWPKPTVSTRESGLLYLPMALKIVSSHFHEGTYYITNLLPSRRAHLFGLNPSLVA